jgi:transposase
MRSSTSAIWGLEHRTLGQINAIGVDEIQYAKGHKYLTLVYQIDIGITRLLWVGKERTFESFQGFFTTMGQEVISKICFVCSDMWEPYLKLIRERCSEALHILDGFHIVSNMNKALDKVRAEETGRMRREGRDPILKKSRWLLWRSSEVSPVTNCAGVKHGQASTYNRRSGRGLTDLPPPVPRRTVASAGGNSLLRATAARR